MSALSPIEWLDATEDALRDMLTNIRDSLADEYHPDPTFCIRCCHVLPARSYIADIVFIRYRSDDVIWGNCMRSLVAPRSPRELSDLRELLQRNVDHCQLPHEDQSHSYLIDTIDQFRMILCQCLFHVLDPRPLCTGLELLPDRNPYRRLSASAEWPTSLEELFPYGPERTVEVVIGLCCDLIDQTAWRVLRGLLELARPRVWDILLKPGNHDRLCWALITTLLLTLPNGEELLSAYPGPAPPDCTIRANWKEARWLFNGSAAEAIHAVLDTIISGPYAQIDDHLDFSSLHSASFRHTMRAAVHHYKDLPRFARFLETVELTEPLRRKVGDSSLISVIERCPRFPGVIRAIKMALKWQGCERRCGAPGCALTLFDRPEGEDKPLPAGSRCQMVRYCQRSCQRNDWNNGVPVAHKVLCPIFIQLQDACDASASDDEYVPLVKNSGIADEHLVVAGKWALSRGKRVQDSLRAMILGALPPRSIVNQSSVQSQS